AAPAPPPEPRVAAAVPAPPQAPSPPAEPRASGAKVTHAPPIATISLPNLLTGARIVMVLFIAILLLWPFGPLLTGALLLFGLAALTDWLDGKLARAWNLETDLGRMMDHIADKLLVAVTLVCLCAVGLIDGLNAFAAALILAREIAISGLREHLGAKGVSVPVTQVAKWKTTFQMVALAAIMAAPLAPLESVARFAGLLILWAAMAMTLVSGLQYVMATKDAWDNDAR
ncbi:MAG: CDP-diacylglycerol--glycerol-3-phosphate 3-phosphatidyltransferase, partial [Pseudomonadota bacterium]